MILLLVEDDEGKSRSISDFVRETFPGSELRTVGSSASALRAIIAGANDIDGVLLDMSMPNFDVCSKEPTGGGTEHFAGRELLAQMKLRRINIPTIIVTMLDQFGEVPTKMSLESLAAQLQANYSPPYCGYVYYNSAQEGWRPALAKLIRENIVKDIK